MTSPTFLNELLENLFKRLPLEDIHKIHEAEKLYSVALLDSRLEDNDEVIDTTINNHVLSLYHDQTPPDSFMNLKIGGSKNV